MSNNTKPISVSYHVIQGGSWNSVASYCRTANRSRFSPGYRFDSLGFRPANRVTKQCDKQH